MCKIEIENITSLSAINPKEWDALFGDDNPFASYAFLYALEASGSVGLRTGWFPDFLVARDEAGHLIGALINYEKHNSYGEYIFDHAFADAYARHGMDYYPKYQMAIPFTPASAPKLAGPDDIQQALLKAQITRLSDRGCSSLHATFLDEKTFELMTGVQGGLRRFGCQFYWHKQEGMHDFDDYLASLKRSQRKSIKKERASIAQNKDLTIKALEPSELTPQMARLFYRFYLTTIDKKWGVPYLTEDFFIRIFAQMPNKILLFLAYEQGEAVAAALNFIGKKRLFGRYWGAFREIDNLHFELCYYRAIDYALKNPDIEIVEAGAQGGHKLKRGYRATKILNACFIANDQFKAPIADYLKHEARDIEEQIEALNQKFSKNEN